MNIFKRAEAILAARAKTGNVAYTNFVVDTNKLFCEDNNATVLMEFVDVGTHHNEIVVIYTDKDSGVRHTFNYNLYDCVEDPEEWVDCMLNDFYDISMEDDEDDEDDE
jgi:hypothetical protein